MFPEDKVTSFFLVSLSSRDTVEVSITIEDGSFPK